MMESEVLVTQVSWIVSMHDACMPLLASLAPNKSQKYGRIVTIVGRAWCCCGPWLVCCSAGSLAMQPLYLWLSCLWLIDSMAFGCLPHTFWQRLTQGVFSKRSLNGCWFAMMILNCCLITLTVRSTPLSRPNKMGLKCLSVRLSVHKTFLQLQWNLVCR